MPEPGRTRRGAGEAIVVAACSLALIAAWWWTPLPLWLNWGGLIHRLQEVGDRPLAPLWVVGIYVVAGFLVVPLTALIIATMAAYGALLGTAYAMLGALASAVATFAIGRVLGEASVRRLFGARFEPLRSRLATCSLLTMTAIRMLPLAPFSVVNLLAGTVGIRFVPYMVGTLLGLAPGCVAFGLVSNGLAGGTAVAGISAALGVAILVVLAIARH